MAPLQQRFDEDSITREEWAWVEDLIKDVAREAESDLFAQKLFQWDLAVKQFRKIENKRIILGTPKPIDLQFHALCLHGLLAIGRALIIDSRRFKPDDLARFKIKHEEIEAYVEELEQSLREWHHGFTEDELIKVREAVFGAKA
ncbi:MAG: hypothetical protein HY298_13745 [Verrucomicrobia bacterium]|nr:hypothetical protein [Verrucomicrobiota bacterium]